MCLAVIKWFFFSFLSWGQKSQTSNLAENLKSRELGEEGGRWKWCSGSTGTNLFPCILTVCPPCSPPPKHMAAVSCGWKSVWPSPPISNAWWNLLTCLLQPNGKGFGSRNREWLIHLVSLVTGYFQSINQLNFFDSVQNHPSNAAERAAAYIFRNGYISLDLLKQLIWRQRDLSQNLVSPLTYLSKIFAFSSFKWGSW